MVTYILPALCVMIYAGVATAQTTAECTLQVNTALPEPDQQPITGTVAFSQTTPGGAVTLTLAITGFNSTDTQLLHGFHVHQTADFTNGCDSTGGHFNPEGVNHGAPTAAVRHVGDLGNIMEDANGGVSTTINDDVIDFSGANDITDRAIVIHEGEDDLGLGGDTGSETTGNAGSRLACCVISITSSAATSSISFITLGLVLFASICKLY